jgi:DNA modification methylase
MDELVFDQKITNDYAVYNGDCIPILETIPKESIHMSIYSPPFAHTGGGLYNYSSSDRDLSNCSTYESFFEHYDFVIEQIERVMLPGRITLVHCMDTPTGNTGRDALLDFPGDIIEYHVKCRNHKCKASEFEKRKGLCGHGWFEHTARYHVWKEPLAVRNRTMAKNLYHSTLVDDSSLCSIASADYLLAFRKKGNNPIPIAHPIGLLDYAGSREIPEDVLKYRGYKGNQIENRYSHWIWRQYASAFWDDIRLEHVLPYKQARDEEDERHVHPLQLDVITRAIVLYSNPGEVVATPFMGVGSEVYEALMNNRKGLGIELKKSYYNQAVKNIARALETRPEQLKMF